MTPFDYAKSVAAFWGGDGEAILKAQAQLQAQMQEGAGKAFAEGLKAMAGGQMPAFPAFPPLHGPVGQEGDTAKAGAALMELWSAAGSLSATLAATLAGAPQPAGTSDTIDATFRHMVDPRNWLGVGGDMNEALGRMAEGPRFADLWDMERRTARVMQAWMGVRRSSLEHNAVTLEAWMRAGRSFLAVMASRSGQGQPPPDRRESVALWTDIANRELIETQRGPAFLQTQGAMIRATTDLRMAQQDLVEHVGKQYGFPTRTELDDVHRSVTALKRELRALRREAAGRAPPPAVPDPEPLPLPPPLPPPPATAEVRPHRAAKPARRR